MSIAFETLDPSSQSLAGYDAYLYGGGGNLMPAYGQALAARGYGPITTEILDAGSFYFAEDYHQQYLAKNPNGYCGLGGTGVSCQIGVGIAAE